jgi:hypothetical protein
MAILRRNCPHCPAEHVAFALVWNAKPNPDHYMWNCCAICGACNRPICFVAINRTAHAPPPTNLSGEIEPQFLVEEIWPQKLSPTAPPHTPAPVAKRFLEGEDAFNRGNWNSAVAMYRSALDIATKGMEGVPEDKMTFFARLEWLHDSHAITPDMRSWADHVRIEGNAALHDPEEFNQIDAKSLRFFTEMFLRYVFELPGAVREFRGEQPG